MINRHTRVGHSLFMWYEPFYKWTWNQTDSLKSQGSHEIWTHTFSSASVNMPPSHSGFFIIKFWRQTNDAMTTSFRSNERLGLCGHKMRIPLGLEPRLLITASRQPHKPGSALPLCYGTPGREQVGTHIYIRTSKVFTFLFITCLQTM